MSQHASTTTKKEQHATTTPEKEQKATETHEKTPAAAPKEQKVNVMTRTFSVGTGMPSETIPGAKGGAIDISYTDAEYIKFKTLNELKMNIRERCGVDTRFQVSIAPLDVRTTLQELEGETYFWCKLVRI